MNEDAPRDARQGAVKPEGTRKYQPLSIFMLIQSSKSGSPFFIVLYPSPGCEGTCAKLKGIFLLDQSEFIYLDYSGCHGSCSCSTDSTGHYSHFGCTELHNYDST